TQQIEAAQQTIQTLAATVEQREDQLNQQTHHLNEQAQQLQEKEQRLQRITQSRGWRLLRLYGRLKYDPLLPITHRLPRVVELPLRREIHPTLAPIHELRQIDGSTVWESTGRDPQFSLSGKRPAGWTEVTLDIKPESAVAGRARLYVDRGAGYSQSDSYDL